MLSVTVKKKSNRAIVSIMLPNLGAIGRLTYDFSVNVGVLSVKFLPNWFKQMETIALVCLFPIINNL
jgi:hypothetical protein